MRREIKARRRKKGLKEEEDIFIQHQLFCNRQDFPFYRIAKYSAGTLHFTEFISIIRPHALSPLGLCSCLLGTVCPCLISPASLYLVYECFQA